MSGWYDPDDIARDYAKAIKDCRTTSDVVPLYADALQTYGTEAMTWSIVNRAFLARWSASSLNKVKREAWRRVKR